MPRKSGKEKRSAKPATVCACAALHTYEAAVTGDNWTVSTFVCVHCGQEHFAEAHPAPTVSARKRRRA